MSLVSKLPYGARAFVVALLVCLAVLLANLLFFQLRPGNPWSVGYGIAATVLLGVLLLYSVARRHIRLRRGRMRWWLTVHSYGGVIFLVLVLFHSAFQAPESALEWGLWISAIWLAVTGLVGATLQTWVPQMLTSGLRTEVLYERIPELVNAVGERAAALAESDPTIADFYERELAHNLAEPRPRFSYCFDVTGGDRRLTREFAHVRSFLTGEPRDKLLELERLYVTKLEMDAQLTLQRILRSWLPFHVPAALLLLVLVAFHIHAVLYY